MYQVLKIMHMLNVLDTFSVGDTKELLYLLFFRELLTLGFCYRGGGRSIRQNYTLTVLCIGSLFIIFL